MTELSRLVALPLLATLALACPSSTARPPAAAGVATTRLRDDPLLKRSAVGEARPLVLDLFLGKPGADAALVQWLGRTPAAPTDDRASA